MKQLKLTILLTLLMSMVGANAFAHDFKVANADGVTIYYVKTSDTEVAVSYKGYSGSEHSNEYTGNVVIPESVTYNDMTYSVTSIGSEAFSSCSGLTSVTIPNSVTSIGSEAFWKCSGLTSVTIPNSVTSIGSSAFAGCYGLTSVTIPNSMTSIDDDAFYGCSALTSITIPYSVTTIGSRTFGYCNSLTSINVEEGNSKYDSRENCDAIIETTSNTLIAGCKETVIPNNVTSIGDYAFYECSSLTSVTIPNSVTTIGSSAFSSCKGLTSVTIPNSVMSIGNSAFYKCSGLTSISIGNSVTNIGDFAFERCKGLTSITIPNSVTSIGISTLRDCIDLTSIIVEAGNTKYDSRNDCNAIIETASNTIIAGCKTTVIPNSVTTIGDNAFSGCSGLTSITIPNSMTTIGAYAFSECSGMTSVTIPNSMTSIGDGAFYKCSNLTSVAVDIETPLSIQSYTFSNRTNATLYVPAGSKATYKAAAYWNEFKEIEEIEPPKCATPTITFTNGKLHFECETEGVTYHYSVTTPVIEDGTSNDVVLPSSYTVNVYATKEGLADSDVVTKDINIRGLKGDVNEDGQVTITDAVGVVDIILDTEK